MAYTRLIHLYEYIDPHRYRHIDGPAPKRMISSRPELMRFKASSFFGFRVGCGKSSSKRVEHELETRVLWVCVGSRTG